MQTQTQQKKLTRILAWLFSFAYLYICGILIREWYLNDYFLPLSMNIFLAAVPVCLFFMWSNYLKERYHRVYLYSVLPAFIGAVTMKIVFYWVDMIAVYYLLK